MRIPSSTSKSRHSRIEGRAKRARRAKRQRKKQADERGFEYKSSVSLVSLPVQYARDGEPSRAERANTNARESKVRKARINAVRSRRLVLGTGDDTRAPRPMMDGRTSHRTAQWNAVQQAMLMIDASPRRCFYFYWPSCAVPNPRFGFFVFAYLLFPLLPFFFFHRPAALSCEHCSCLRINNITIRLSHDSFRSQTKFCGSFFFSNQQETFY